MTTQAAPSLNISSLCTERCGGLCCNPWWGIISYTGVKKSGLNSLDSFKKDLARGIEARAARITAAYVTREPTPRALFTAPEKYNVVVKGITVVGEAIEVNLVAMFAYRCALLAPDGTCSIHPSRLGGADIRPPHCAELGATEARPGEKGYCRIVHAAASCGALSAEVDEAIALEKRTARGHLSTGFRNAIEAADFVVSKVLEHCHANAPQLFGIPAAPALGRNEPCHCGSGKKYKKCHGAAL